MDSTKGKSLLKSLFGEKRAPGCLGFFGGMSNYPLRWGLFLCQNKDPFEPICIMESKRVFCLSNEVSSKAGQVLVGPPSIFWGYRYRVVKKKSDSGKSSIAKGLVGHGWL